MVVHHRKVNDGSASRPGTAVVGGTTMRFKRNIRTSMPLNQRKSFEANSAASSEAAE